MASSQKKTTAELAEELHTQEVQRVNYLQQLVNAIHNQKVKTDKEKGTIDISLSPGELKDLIALEENLMKLKRKVNGLIQW
jgi:transcription initiation factor IIF auxiliary subunit